MTIDICDKTAVDISLTSVVPDPLTLYDCRPYATSLTLHDRGLGLTVSVTEVQVRTTVVVVADSLTSQSPNHSLK